MNTLATPLTGLPMKEVELPTTEQGGPGGYTSFQTDGTPIAIGVPMSDSDPDLAIRLHEYGHLILRDTESQIPLKYPNPIIQAVCDVHVNSFLIAHGANGVAKLPLSPPANDKDPLTNRIANILIDYRSYGLDFTGEIALDAETRSEIRDAQALAANAVTTADLEQAIIALQNIIALPPTGGKGEPTEDGEPGEPSLEDEPGKPGAGSSDSEDDSDSESESESDDPDPDTFESEDEPEESGKSGGSDSDKSTGVPKQPSKAPQTPQELSEEIQRSLESIRNEQLTEKRKADIEAGKIDRAKRRQPEYEDSEVTVEDVPVDSTNPMCDGSWMRMVIAHPKLQRRLKQMRDYGRATKASYNCGPMRFPLRALPGIGDGKIFGSVNRGKRGTILIDWSGSMSIKPEDITKMLEIAPKMQIATYCGKVNYKHAASEKGELRILARHGRMAETKDLVQYGAANGIDGPALTWLARQPAPRYWICDGIVTGHNDGACGWMRPLCFKFIKSHFIKNFHDLAEFYLFMDKMKA